MHFWKNRRKLIVAIHKKESKSLIKNYQKSLLPIFNKAFERLIFNILFNIFILQNNLFTPCQYGFILGDSCVLQLLSIIHEICKSFDCRSPTDMRITFLDISKACDKVWYGGWTFKLKTYGVDSSLLKILKKYLNA